MIGVNVDDTIVDVRGGGVFVRTWTPDRGSAGPPVVLLHDSLGSVDLWRDFPEALAHALARPVIAYDRLGFGRSSARQGMPSVDFISEEAEVHFPAIAGALDITEFSLFGHSVGGAMALVIAALRPSACRWAVSESAQAFVEQRTLAGILAAKETFVRPGQIEKLARWHGDKARWVLDAWTRVWLSPEFASWSLDPYLDKVECPVLVVHGELDEYGSVEFPNRIASGVHGAAQLAILPGCGHVPHREQREQVLALACAFVAAVEASPPHASAPDVDPAAAT